VGNIEICKDILPWIENSDEMIGRAEIIDEVSFVNLQDLIKIKKLFNREKDKIDIKLIEEYLKKNN
jgi:hypothetical protein